MGIVSAIRRDSPARGETGAAPNLTDTPVSGYLGSDRLTVKVNDGVLRLRLRHGKYQRQLTNTAPSVAAIVALTRTRRLISLLLANDADGIRYPT